MFLHYWGAAIGRSLSDALDWVIEHGIIFDVLTAVGGIVSAVVVLRRRATMETVTQLVGGWIIAILVLFVLFLLNDAPNQIRIRDERIAQLGGAPDTPIAVPGSLRGSNDNRVLAVVGELSDIINKDIQAVCDEAKVALACIQQIRTVQPSDCAAKTDKVFIKGRKILSRFWTGANTGFLNAGDPEILEILNRAIQPKDRQVFIDFDQYALGAYNEMYFLSLIESSGDERRRLFEPALNLADSRNRWSEATESYCRLIGEMNSRISEIRRQISQ